MSRAAFWKSICADPDDDTVRLAFADWLDENDDPAFAEFIRAQIDLAAAEAWSERAVDLRIREQVLLRDHREEWLAALPGWVPRSRVRFARGFPVSVACPAATFLEIGPDLAAATPVQEVELSDLTPDVVAELAAAPHLARLRGVALHDGAGAWPALLASEHLAGLRRLALTHVGQWEVPFPIDRYLAGFHLPVVQQLSGFSLGVRRYLWDEAIPGALFGELDRVSPGRLRTLDVNVPSTTWSTLGGLISGPVGVNLRELHFRETPGDSLEQFATTPELPGLRTLQFNVIRDHNSTVWTPALLPGVFRAAALKHAVALDMSGLPAGACVALATSPIARQLRRLSLGDAPTELEGIRWVAEAFPNLLDFRYPGLDDAKLRELIAGRGLESVRHIDLSRARVTPRALDMLASTGRFPNLAAVTVSAAFGPGNLHESGVMRAFASKYDHRFAVLLPE